MYTLVRFVVHFYSCNVCNDLSAVAQYTSRGTRWLYGVGTQKNKVAQK